MGIAPHCEHLEKANRSRGRDAKPWGSCKRARQAADSCSPLKLGDIVRVVRSVTRDICFLVSSLAIHQYRRIDNTSRSLHNGLKQADRCNPSANLGGSIMWSR